MGSVRKEQVKEDDMARAPRGSKQGHEISAPTADMRRVRTVWEHELPYVRANLKKFGQGYTYAIVKAPVKSGRIYYVFAKPNVGLMPSQDFKLPSRLEKHITNCAPRTEKYERYYNQTPTC